MASRGGLRSKVTRKVCSLLTTVLGDLPLLANSSSDALVDSSNRNIVGISDSPGTPGSVTLVASAAGATTVAVAAYVHDPLPDPITGIQELEIYGNQFVGGNPSPARWLGKLLRNRSVRGFYPRLENVPPDVILEWHTVFVGLYSFPKASEAEIEGAWKLILSDRYRYFIYENKKIWANKGNRPNIFNDVLWAEYAAYWGSEKVVAISERNKKNKVGNGAGTKHTAGSANFATQHARQVDVYGTAVTPGDTYVSLHTKLDSNGISRWISGVHEDTWEEYKRLALIEVAESRAEPTSRGRTAWIPELWQRVATNGRRKKGKRILGFGEHGAELLGLSTSQRGVVGLLSSSSTLLNPSHQIHTAVNASLAEDRQLAQQREESLRAEIQRLKEESHATQNMMRSMMQMMHSRQSQERSQLMSMAPHQQHQIGSDFMTLLQQEDYTPDMTNI